MFLTAYNNKGEIDVANFDQFANLHQARVRDDVLCIFRSVDGRPRAVGVGPSIRLALVYYDKTPSS